MAEDESQRRAQGRSADPDERRLAERLSELNARVTARQEAKAGDEPRAQRDMRGLAQALRLSSEFVAGTIVGAGIGWVADRFLGSSPWGLVVFTLLGFAAGVYNMMRSVGALPKAGERSPPPG